MPRVWSLLLHRRISHRICLTQRGSLNRLCVFAFAVAAATAQGWQRCPIPWERERRLIFPRLAHPLSNPKGLPPLCRQGSPPRSDPHLRYRSGVDKLLTAFTPLGIKQASGFLRKPSLSIFLFVSALESMSRFSGNHSAHHGAAAYYLAVRGISSPRTSLCFFAWLAHVPQSWRSGFGQALPDDRRAPEGLGA
jgi:hypothetical protein